MNCWHKWNPPLSKNASSAFSARVDMTGLPGSHALPNSNTIEPFGFSSSRKRGAKAASHCTYSSPLRFPYFFLRFSGNGGDVKISWTLPRSFFATPEANTCSAPPTIIWPRSVEKPSRGNFGSELLEVSVLKSVREMRKFTLHFAKSQRDRKST